MTRSLQSRIRALETATNGPPQYVVPMPHEAWDSAELWDATISAHRAATGYGGPVMVAPDPPCLTEDEWIARYGRRGDEA